MKNQWIIIDWAGNTCFESKIFTSFDEGWSFIYDYFNDYENPEEEYQEFFVVKIK